MGSGRFLAAGPTSVSRLPRPQLERYARIPGTACGRQNPSPFTTGIGHGHPPIPYDVYKLYFLCEILLNEEPALWVDAAEVGVFGEENLPSLYLTRVIPTQISCFFEHHRNPNLPTDLD